MRGWQGQAPGRPGSVLRCNRARAAHAHRRSRSHPNLRRPPPHPSWNHTLADPSQITGLTSTVDYLEYLPGASEYRKHSPG